MEALPGGLDASIAAGGSDLSGGQRQRTQLARAVYAAPEVLLAVEPTSAVDANTEAAMIMLEGTLEVVLGTQRRTVGPGHVVLAPAVALSLTLMAFNFLGDGLRDALDPRQKR